MDDTIIITAAITGAVHTPTMSDHLPLTPEQIADEVVRVHGAGAAVAHIHVRDPETGRPTPDHGLFTQVASSVKERCDIVLNFTTGGGINQSLEERVATVDRFKPELASCNYGSMNFAWFPYAERPRDWKFDWEEPWIRSTEDYIFPNTFKTLASYGEIFGRNGTKPELEIYDLGMVNNAAFMLERGALTRPVYMQFVLGILGGAPAEIENLIFLRNAARTAIGNDLIWSVCAAGRHQTMICTAGITLGGHIRVGLEDNLYLERGKLATSSAQQVEKMVRIATEVGRTPATPDQAREILQLKGLANVAY